MYLGRIQCIDGSNNDRIRNPNGFCIGVKFIVLATSSVSIMTLINSVPSKYRTKLAYFSSILKGTGLIRYGKCYFEALLLKLFFWKMKITGAWSVLLNCVLKVLKGKESTSFFNFPQSLSSFIDISAHFAILHCSPVADTLESEVLVNDLCNQSTNDKHNLEWNMMKYKLNTLHKKCFTKLVKEEGEHLSSRSAFPKAALPYPAEQVIKCLPYALRS